MSLPAPIVVYHLWPYAGWEAMHTRLWDALLSDGLHEAAAEIFVGLSPLSPPVAERDIDVEGKAKVIPLAHPFSEMPTLRLLHSLATHRNPETPMLYWHCRGVRYKEGVDHEYGPALDHTLMMTHFLVERWREALEGFTKGIDVVACNIQRDPKWHVSGNFWWAKAGAIASLVPPTMLPDPVTPETLVAHRQEAEWFIGQIPRGRMRSLHTSGVHHYQERYPRERYA